MRMKFDNLYWVLFVLQNISSRMVMEEESGKHVNIPGATLQCESGGDLPL